MPHLTDTSDVVHGDCVFRSRHTSLSAIFFCWRNIDHECLWPASRIALSYDWSPTVLIHFSTTWTLRAKGTLSTRCTPSHHRIWHCTRWRDLANGTPDSSQALYLSHQISSLPSRYLQILSHRRLVIDLLLSHSYRWILPGEILSLY
jgi:hypothetical protein